MGVFLSKVSRTNNFRTKDLSSRRELSFQLKSKLNARLKLISIIVADSSNRNLNSITPNGHHLQSVLLHLMQLSFLRLTSRTAIQPCVLSIQQSDYQSDTISIDRTIPRIQRALR